MKNCPKCGRELFDEAVICPGCGCPVETADEEKDSNSTPKAIAYGAIVLGIVATVLPFFKVSLFGVSKSITMWDGDYKYISAFGLVISFILLYELIKNKKSMRRDTIFVGVIVVIEIVVQYTNVKSNLSTTSGIDLSSLVSPDIGFYLLVISGIMLFIAGSMMKKLQ